MAYKQLLDNMRRVLVVNIHLYVSLNLFRASHIKATLCRNLVQCRESGKWTVGAKISYQLIVYVHRDPMSFGC